MADDDGPRSRGRTGALLGIALAAIAAIAGCGPAVGPGDQVTIDGSLFTDFIVDQPCDRQVGPPELVGVRLTIRAGAGEILGQVATGALRAIELPKGPGTATWSHGGCRFAAPFSVSLPPAATYEVTFEAAAAGSSTSGFIGVDALEPQSVSHADLEAAGFVWTFEVRPEFAVP